MSNNAHAGRNEPCPCGSGKKRKVCHPEIEEPAVVEAERSSWKLLTVTAVVIAGVVGLAYTFGKPPTPVVVPPLTTSTPPSGLSPLSASMGGITPQPPGPVPPGKVWSPEHGHWHDITSGGAQPTPMPMPTITGASGVLTPIPAPPGAGQSPTPGVPVPQPAGEVPPGKVWSSEHGHWHDVAPGAASPTTVPH